jgi:hypothetical protein
MGPASVHSEHWKLYQDKVKEQTGKSYADPWNLKMPSTAAAVYLKDLGQGSSQGSIRRHPSITEALLPTPPVFRPEPGV